MNGHSFIKRSTVGGLGGNPKPPGGAGKDHEPNRSRERIVRNAIKAAIRNIAPLAIDDARDELTLARRRQIFLAVCRVLERKSFHVATVKEIALEAGLAAGSIYVYLQSKDDILLLIVDSMIGELIEMIPDVRRRGANNPRRELVALMGAVIDVTDSHREAFCTINQEVRYLARHADYRSALGQSVARYTSTVEELLERGRRAGVIRFGDLHSAVEAIHMLCSGWAMGCDYLVSTDKETYKREIAAIVAGRFFAAGERAAKA